MTSIIKTNDGSNSIYSNIFNDQYHSLHGAFQESEHIYIQTGFNYCKQNPIKIFEVGFGTGLNTILTIREGLKRNIRIEYHTIELFPLGLNLINQLNYSEFLSPDLNVFYNQLHECKWNEEIEITKKFIFRKIKSDFHNYSFDKKFDLIYFDAFASEKQPTMWTTKIFTKIYNCLNQEGILTTYSSKGIVKNNLRDVGFYVKRLAGPKGKRHILRASKI